MTDADASLDRLNPRDDASIDMSEPETFVDGLADDMRRDLATDATTMNDQASEPDACDPGTSKSPAESTCLISERYGVFVSPKGSDATGAGTRGAPYRTLPRALHGAKAETMRVYACDEGTGYIDALTIDATFDGVNLYGGFECATWTYATTRRARVHPASGTALTVKSLTTGVTVEDFEFDAADAAMGASSTGAVVDTALNVVLRGVKVVAGNGGGGANGVDGGQGADGWPTGGQQNGFPAACPFGSPMQRGGIWSDPSGCDSQGGPGGQANQANLGNAGNPGAPPWDVTPPNVDNRGAEGPVGEDGKAGSPGNAGDRGVPGSAFGTFVAASYVIGPGGSFGTVGKVGQGGGGGGGSNVTEWPTLCIGASGGAGGMGGCGGEPGTGGASAGASVALISWMSLLTLDRSELTSAAGGSGGSGGNGGKGGKGQSGGTGGAAYEGDAGAPLGKGGNGGPGGNGGSGAGGNGGPSCALVYKGTAPTKLNGTVVVHGPAGLKGTGGSVDNAKAPDGLTGTVADEFAVP
jgi:hypothetical protein